ncbi:MAG: class I SAM-dependent DNA methyltransferase [Candidatus Kapabacteria bacterium]|nr:class I SAM-dependent DNA methyltransferase [Candidatus Kapabacteria bacterium]
MNLTVYNSIVNFIWNIADDVLRDVYVRGKYKDVILPMTVIRRIDCLLEPTKNKVLEMHKFFDEKKIANQAPGLKRESGYVFYNTSEYTLKKLLREPEHIKKNFEDYLNGFSDNIQEIISKFKLRNQLETLHEGNILFKMIEKFTTNKINLSPEPVKNSDGEILQEGLSNLGMGYVFEELIRRFNEDNNEEAGEHFTPRDIIKLMAHTIFLPIKDKIEDGTFLMYDPAGGSGGMLTESEKFVIDDEGEIRSKAYWHLYAQEVNPETYAICTADMLIRGEENIHTFFGSTLKTDGFPHLKFDFMMTNPPYGKSWKVDQEYIFDTKKKEILDPRFKVGLPRISDGQLLFTVNMLSKMKTDTELGSRIATIHNGSALFTGDAGSGESEIRKWIIENDWLECIIALPVNMFYNTGISTFIWILSNKKKEKRKGKVQLINAVDVFEKMRKSLGNKSNTFTEEHIKQITQIYLDFKESEISKIFDNSDFGYYKTTVERPLRLSVQITPEKLELLKQVKAIVEFDKISKLLIELFGNSIHDDFNVFKEKFEKGLKKKELKVGNKELNSIYDNFSYKDETAKPVIKKKTKELSEYEPDSELRDYENVPLKDSIEEYFKKEVLPYTPDAWIDETKTITGYEISFNKYFYKYQPLSSIEEITKDILTLEKETEGLLTKILSFNI